MKVKHRNELTKRVKWAAFKTGILHPFRVSSYAYQYRCTCHGECSGACDKGKLRIKTDQGILRFRCTIPEVPFLINHFEKNTNPKTGSCWLGSPEVVR